MVKKIPLPLFLFTVMALLFPFALTAESGGALHHDLKIILHPSENGLSGFDTLTVSSHDGSGLTLLLSQTASVHTVSVSGRKRVFSLKNGQLLIPLKGDDRASPLTLYIEYSASFHDPVPDTFTNTDNPGYGVTGIVSERGTFLQTGAGWYPEIPGSRPTFHLQVEAPSGTLAVTSGRCLGHKTENGKTYSEWETGFPSEGLALSAGPYRVEEKIFGSVPVATYFFPESSSLSQEYLREAGRYIALYEELIGPYPFQQFSIVENFFPTGYGFPSYTLLGSTVIQLPFIIETSLGHEIAHCWWGNGVRVDYRQGNWCEGLTTYLADYLYKERISEEEGRDYRLQILRNFTTLVNPRNDFPLSQFKGRYDPSSQAIGYGKAAMVFHMVRRSIGDRAFWDGLREVFRDKLFKEASWKDFQIAFERRAGLSLESFFEQWILRKGAPRISLRNPAMESAGAWWTITGSIVQKEPSYDLSLPLRLTSPAGKKDKKILVRGKETMFQIDSQHKPFRLDVDPEYDVMRILYPSEIPPSVNSLKGSSSVLLVLPKTAFAQSKEIAGFLAESLGLKRFKILSEDELTVRDSKENDLLLVGLTEESPPPFKRPKGLALQAHRFKVNGREYGRPSDSFFGVFRSSDHEGRVVAIFRPPSDQHAHEVARKITHYGRYSYLVFREGRNEAKGTWPVTESPLVHEWEKKNERE
jgi:Peptidase family M1 domain